ncbi:hypothetical protein JOC55_006431 [Paenibacillus sacheonensis]|nr:hypothetical protein [Paenibacillus sacheonensis]
MQCWRFRFNDFRLTAFTDQLVNCWHVVHPPSSLSKAFKTYRLIKPTDPGGS